ncbi:MAG: 4-(cytidine 5'-diphospho)-2-C-methyl-D-erythritol kinase [Pseudomonadota bacterium]
MAAETRVEALARAKVNLHLHILGRRADGMHLLDSIVVFPDLGDWLEAEPAAGLGLSLAGPFADALGGGENLALRAAEALRTHAPGRPGAALRLVKSLPVAGGIGGGSADAAAVLRALNRLWRLDFPEARLAEIGLSLGADVPVCLRAPRAARMGGVGEVVAPAPPMPGFWLVLANSGEQAPTPDVFRRLARRDGARAEAPAKGFADAAALADWLRGTENMLETPAREVAPGISLVLSELEGLPGCLLARMSGSGATCFGLFAEEAAALAAAERMREAGLWSAAAPVRASAPIAAVGDAGE